MNVVVAHHLLCECNSPAYWLVLDRHTHATLNLMHTNSNPISEIIILSRSQLILFIHFWKEFIALHSANVIDYTFSTRAAREPISNNFSIWWDEWQRHVGARCECVCVCACIVFAYFFVCGWLLFLLSKRLNHNTSPICTLIPHSSYLNSTYASCMSLHDTDIIYLQLCILELKIIFH